MFKKILVPLDGSDLSADVLPVVLRLVEGAGAEVTLFTSGQAPKSTPLRRRALRRPVPVAAMPGTYARGVIPAQAPSYAENPDQAMERREHELFEYLDDVAKPLVKAGAGVRTVVHFGEPATEIIEQAKRGGFDLIVMATHGRSGLSEKLHGSVAAAVIRRGVMPVLVVRPKSGRRRTRLEGRSEAARR